LPEISLFWGEWQLAQWVDLSGAISLWPDGTRRLILFYCYEIGGWYWDLFPGEYSGPWMRFLDIENLGM